MALFKRNSRASSYQKSHAPSHADEYAHNAEKLRRRGRRKVLFFCFLFLAVFGSVGFIWAAMHAPVFKLQHLEVVGVASIASSDVEQLVAKELIERSKLRSLLGTANFLAWVGLHDVAGTSSTLPRMKRVEVVKNYWDRKIVLAVEERMPFGIWCSFASSPSECVWFDEEGVVLGAAPFAEGSLIRVLHDYSSEGKTLPSPLLRQNLMPHLISVFKALHASGVGVKELRLHDRGLEEIKVSTREGPELYFSLRFPADSSVPVITSLLKEKGASGFAKLQYIDFRVEKRAYYK